MSDDRSEPAAPDAALDDEAMGDEVYQPPDYGTRDDPTDVDLDNALGQGDLDETLDEGYSPPEKPLAVNDYGTTAAEQRERETLDQRLAEEVPEVSEPAGNGIGDQPGMAGEPMAAELSGEDRAGRLVRADNETLRRTDGIAAADVGIDGGAAGAEEAAMHLAEDEQEEKAEDFGS
ncbi:MULTISPECIES: DUF5709 domain-containing protein [unclassified Streptomyces]|uniref:DUF5709 domain-containing protein n=1 Tax=Streptomyces johnsoniae TaxID=3075532 RepID=A0ABU2SBR4_9ACTN|nr:MULTISPECIES: DUF5709 domain-containing protein [unclassified Streptomyces]MDT0446423.1 DUF5709 domain-containing protein [Streptomyces sp. DSM 41886]ONK16008.1 hypothetical protein STBA_68580 [Streptomyces sp. MP131-18]